MGTPNLQLLDFIASTFNIKAFVETGTAHAETALKVLNIFSSIYTVELADSLYQEANGKLASTHARCYHNNSVDFLKMILPELGQAPIVYWLDAHWDGGSTAGVDEQCPLLNELEVINGREGNNDFILIDDAHVFFSPAVLGGQETHDIKQWPDLTQIFPMLSKKDRYTIILASWRCAIHGKPGEIVMPEDVIVSVPYFARDQLYRWLISLNLEH